MNELLLLWFFFRTEKVNSQLNKNKQNQINKGLSNKEDQASKRRNGIKLQHVEVKSFQKQNKTNLSSTS